MEKEKKFMKKTPLEIRPSLFPLMPLFLEKMFNEHGKVMTAIKSGDVDQLVFLCHANKGAAAIFGCHTLSQMLQDLEDCGRLARLGAIDISCQGDRHISYQSF